MRTRRAPQEERRWPWFGQIRDAAAAILAVVIGSVETWRGTYNLKAMGFVAICLGVAGAGAFGRWLVRRYEDEERRGG